MKTRTYVLAAEKADRVRGLNTLIVLETLKCLQIDYNADAVPHHLAMAAMRNKNVGENYETMIGRGVIIKFTIPTSYKMRNDGRLRVI